MQERCIYTCYTCFNSVHLQWMASVILSHYGVLRSDTADALFTITAGEYKILQNPVVHSIPWAFSSIISLQQEWSVALWAEAAPPEITARRKMNNQTGSTKEAWLAFSVDNSAELSLFEPDELGMKGSDCILNYGSRVQWSKGVLINTC